MAVYSEKTTEAVTEMKMEKKTGNNITLYIKKIILNTERYSVIIIKIP